MRLPVISAALCLTALLSACGVRTAQLPPAPEAAAPATTAILPGLVFDEQGGQQLLTAQDNVDGSLDYRLYLKDGQGQIRSVALPLGNLLVIGAAFMPDLQGAYAVLRFDTPQGSSDALYALSFTGSAPRELHRLAHSEVSGTLLNSLRLQGNTLQFTADHLEREGASLHPQSAVFALDVTGGVGAQSGAELRVLSKGSAAATDYAAFLKSLSSRDLAALRVTAGLGAQAVTGYLSWPKASSGHNAAGSYLHGTGADQYALDINRGSGDFDLGDDVLSARSGDVIQRSAYTTVGSYGNYLVIRHGNSYTTHYAHLSAMHVNQGSYVTTQQYIGDVGKTGLNPNDSTQTAHLHFAFRDQYGNAAQLASSAFPMNAKLSGGTCGITNDMHDGREYYRC